MEILRTIALYAEAKQKRFTLIGGHAIQFYGLSRQTGDIDLLVCRNEKAWWIETLERLRYQVGQNDEFFALFRPVELGEWPIDLMFVDEQTFDKIYKDAAIAVVGLADDVRVISMRHLAALKIHALKREQPHRSAKDYNDLLYIVRDPRCGLTHDEVKGMCVKYASTDLYEKLVMDWPLSSGVR